MWNMESGEGIEMEIGPKTVAWIGYLRPDLGTGGIKVLVDRDPEAVKLLKQTEKGSRVLLADTGNLGGEVEDNSVGVVLAKDFFGAHGLHPATV